MHAGPGQVDRHDIGGNAGGNLRTGGAEVPKIGGQAAGASAGSNSSGNAAQDNRRSDRSDRGGWSKFGPPSGRSNSDVGSGHSEQTPSGSRFPLGGDRQTNDRQSNDRQINDRSMGGQTSQPSDRGITQAPRTDSGGWQKFPSNSDRGAGSSSNRGNDRVDQGGSKPPLELHRPIVTPRQSDNSNDSRGNNRGNDSRYSPPPQRTPEVHNEPRYNPPPSSRNDRSYSPPSRSDRSYSPPSRSERSYSPPSRSESRGSGGGSSSHGGGSSHESGGHSDSKSSSSPKHR